MKISGLCAAALLFGTSLAFAQSMTVDEIKALVDQRVGALDEYQELLNDPDSRRAMAAMTIMLESGDPDLVRMGKQYGLFSPDTAVKQTALKAFFDSEPLIEVVMTAPKSGRDNFIRSIRQEDGSSRPDGTAYVSFKLGSEDPSKSCYVYPNTGGLCAIRLNSGVVSYNFYNDGWGELKLTDTGSLEGFIPVSGAGEPIAATIKIAQ